MPITLNDNAAVHANKPIDSRYMNYLSGSSSPWASAAAAIAGIPSAYRYQFLTVLAQAANGDVLEYWWRVDTTDGSLEPKNKESVTLNANGSITLGAGYYYGSIIVLPTTSITSLQIGSTSGGTDYEAGQNVAGGTAYSLSWNAFVATNTSIFFTNITTGTKIVSYKTF